MNVNSIIKKLLIYINYNNYINKTNISYSYNFNTITTKITLTKWLKEDGQNIKLEQWENLDKYSLIETLQELADDLD